MAKQFKPFWKDRTGSIQEPSPHHTCLCKKCGYVYNRNGKKSTKCRSCKTKYGKDICFTEFYVGKKKIYVGKNLEGQRKKLK
jgi:hypothetical protein